MTDKKWEKLIYEVEEKFGILDRFQEDFVVDETTRGGEIYGKKDIVLFKGPIGKIKLERETRPRVVDKKVLHTRRIGGRVAMDYVYSNEDTVTQLKVYKENEEGEWEEIKDFL